MRQVHRFCETWRSAIVLAVIALAALYYFVLLSVMAKHGHGLFPPISLGLTFNSMLEHLLRHQFDVAPAAIGGEGFEKDGKTYAYFGIFPALLRLPLLPFVDLRTTDVTLLSLWVATVVMLGAKLRALLFLYDRSPATSLRLNLFSALAVYEIAGGAQIQFLKASIYQEVVSWAGALAAIFVYLAIRILLSPREARLLPLAAAMIVAGLCLLTRMSTALGLLAAAGPLLLFSVVRENSEFPERPVRGRFLGAYRVCWGNALFSLLILSMFVTLCAYINYMRWGDPLEFVPFQLQIFYRDQFPHRLEVLREYGTINVIRMGFTVFYYFLPIWIVRDASGQFLLEDFGRRTIDAIELPPASFFMSDLVLIVFFSVFVFRVLGRKLKGAGLDALVAASVTLGLTASGALMLFAPSATYRYRMEFLPALEFAGFLGCYALCGVGADDRGSTRRRWGYGIWAASLLSVVASQLSWALYALSGFGPATTQMPDGIVAYYVKSFAVAFPSVVRLWQTLRGYP